MAASKCLWITWEIKVLCDTVLGLKGCFPTNKLNGAKDHSQAPDLSCLHSCIARVVLLAGLLERCRTPFWLFRIPQQCLSRNLPREIFWTHWPWLSTKLFHRVSFWPFLTDHMQYFRTWKILILHLHQPLKDCCMDLFFHLLSLKFKKIFWKMVKILWFLILNSYWKFLRLLINDAFFLVPKTIKKPMGVFWSQASSNLFIISSEACT